MLQTTDPASRIEAPYERVPQLGTRYAGRVGLGFDVGFESEFNRFTHPAEQRCCRAPPACGRMRWAASAGRYVTPGWTLVPKLSFNAASYALDESGRRRPPQCRRA